MAAAKPDHSTVQLHLMQSILDQLDQGITVIDGQLRLILWNHRFTEFFTLPEELLRVGTPFEDIIRHNAHMGEYGPGDPEEFVAERMQWARNVQPHKVQRTRPGGQVIEIIGNPLPGGGFVTTYTDVTITQQVTDNLRVSNERLDQMVERRTRALKESEERHRAYAELLEATVRHMPVGISVFDNDLNLVVANRQCIDLTRMPESYLTPGTTFESFMLFNAQRGEYGPGDPVELARKRVEVARRMEAHAFERIRPDGSVMEVRGSPIPGRGFISIFSDITARHKAEETLRSAISMARTMLDAPGLVIFLITESGSIVEINEGGAKAFHSTKEALLGQNVYELMDKTVGVRRKQVSEQVLAKGRAIHFEDEHRGHWYEISVAPFPVQPDSERMVMVISHDVTHRHQAEQQLREAMAMAETANRSKTDFLASMSHELRTPLNAIIGFSELITRAMFGPIPDRYREYSADINAAGQHLLAMINDILDISRIEIGAFTLDFERVAPRQLAESCLRLVSHRAEQNGVELESRIPDQLPWLRVDVRRAKQVLLNVLANAVKFTPSGGHVVLIAERTEDQGLRFLVSDTGIGMSEADMSVALTPFGQVDSGLDRRFEGVGLGLPLAKSLIEMHGGQLGIRSSPGEGTTVILTFPPSCLEQEDSASVPL